MRIYIRELESKIEKQIENRDKGNTEGGNGEEKEREETE